MFCARVHSLWLPVSLKISPKCEWSWEPSCAILFSPAPFLVSTNGGWVPQAERSPSPTDAKAWKRHLRRRWCPLFWWVTTTKTKTECVSRSQKGNWHLFSSPLEFVFCETQLIFQTLYTCDQERQSPHTYLLIMIIRVKGILNDNGYQHNAINLIQEN